MPPLQTKIDINRHLVFEQAELYDNAVLTNQQQLTGSAMMVSFYLLYSNPHPCTHTSHPHNMMIPLTTQTRVFDPKGNETYVIARQADLTSLL